MSRYHSACAISVLLAFASLAAPSWAKEPDKRPASDADSGVSIFNDQLRRFKFLLEHEVATVETAEGFLVRYRRPENPPIIGAYPDAQTNALVVIGPPEAEQAIRECLAERIAEVQGIIGAPPLPMQLRLLQHERTELLELMADLEVQEVGAASDENGAAKAKQLVERRKLFEAELSTVEQQIRVVRKYMARVEADESAPVAAADRE